MESSFSMESSPLLSLPLPSAAMAVQQHMIREFRPFSLFWGKDPFFMTPQPLHQMSAWQHPFLQTALNGALLRGTEGSTLS